MLKIFKYLIRPRGNGLITLGLPRNAEILTIAFQRSQLYLWAIVNPEEEEQNVVIVMYGTGWDIIEEDSGKLTYICTTQQDGGNFIWHFFIKET